MCIQAHKNTLRAGFVKVCPFWWPRYCRQFDVYLQIGFQRIYGPLSDLPQQSYLMPGMLLHLPTMIYGKQHKEFVWLFFSIFLWNKRKISTWIKYTTVFRTVVPTLSILYLSIYIPLRTPFSSDPGDSWPMRHLIWVGDMTWPQKSSYLYTYLPTHISACNYYKTSTFSQMNCIAC